MPKIRSLLRTAAGVCLCAVASGGAIASPAPGMEQPGHFHLERVTGPNSIGNGQANFGQVEIWGTEASEFNLDLWKRDSLHWISDLRAPLLTPKQAGPFRNIYAPSAVEESWGWRVFYSGWDGTNSANDRVYASTTGRDFIDIEERHLLIDHGSFNHVSNVLVKRSGPSTYLMVATAAVTRPGEYFNTNKPVAFVLPSTAMDRGADPQEAKENELLGISGYPSYDIADLNGANALDVNGSCVALYFSDWRNPGKVFLAQGPAIAALRYKGIALRSSLAPNDLRRLSVSGHEVLLLGLYKKGDVGQSARGSNHLWYSLAVDGKSLGPVQQLFSAQGPADRFIFSMGFVSRGKRILGVLYGAGGDFGDSRNRIFARWLQKRLVLRAREGLDEGNGAEYEADGAIGPNRQVFTLPRLQSFDGELLLYDDDGERLLGRAPVHLESGAIYKIVFDRK